MKRAAAGGNGSRKGTSSCKEDYPECNPKDGSGQVPLYDYRCPECGRKFEVFIHSISKVNELVHSCEICGCQTTRLLSQGRFKFATGHFFEPYVDTDISGEPIEIHSQDQFFRECEKHGKGYKKVPDKMR